MTFAEGSQLERIGEYCFANSGLEEFIAPPGLKEIERGAFEDCKNLKRVVLNDELDTLGIDDEGRDADYKPYWCGVFMSSGLEEITFSTKPYCGKHTFAGCDDLTVIRVINEDNGN